MGYRLGGRAPTARQAKGPSAAAMTFTVEATFLSRLLRPEATLSEAILSEATLSEATLSEATLSEATLSKIH